MPLIVVTGVPSLSTAIEGLRLGIADYLLKPVSYKDLLSSIQRVLGSQQQALTTQRRGDAQAGESAR